ncbi:MAG: LD-carboxypeptidase [Burkholderiales bacterium]|nr:LD-carboxypeptidase [Burkholderiales bacterium]
MSSSSARKNFTPASAKVPIGASAGTDDVSAPSPSSLTIFTPAGVLLSAAPLRLAARRLKGLGFDVSLDEAVLARQQRFGGDDATRLAAIHRVARAAPAVALASRGGYGMTRLLDQLDWTLLEQSIERGTRWVGYSDVTALHMGLLAHLKAGNHPLSWAGPLAVDDFGRAEEDGGLDEVTPDCFVEAMNGELEAVGFRTEVGFDGLDVTGRLWGGNLTVLMSLLGTPHWPRVKGGVLMLEDINEHPYRVERMLLQLHQAGVLGQQKAVLVGDLGGWRKSPMDRGYNVKSALAHLRSVSAVPILTGLPFGHVPTKVCLPMGVKVQLVVDGRDALLAW